MARTCPFRANGFRQTKPFGRPQRLGFDSHCPTAFLWEGVTNYLTADGVDSILKYVAGCAAGSMLIFTYVHRGALDGSGRFADAEETVG